MRTLLTGVATLALIAAAVLIFAPDPQPMTPREVEMFITSSPARCQNGLRAAFIARRGTPLLPGRAEQLRDRVCAPDVLVIGR